MSHDLDTLFIRVNSRPRRDLARGYSYSMGCFGDESEAHEGLSGYSLGGGVEDAVVELDDRMGVSGEFTSDGLLARYRPHALMFVTVYRGRYVGQGPDGEDLFEPHEIVASWKTREIEDADDLIERLAALGIRDEE